MVSKTILEKAWDQMDELFDRGTSQETTSEEKFAIRNEIKGMARVVIMFMQPYYPTIRDMMTELQRRKKLRLEGVEATAFGTLGLGTLKYAPAPGHEDVRPRVERPRSGSQQPRSENFAKKFSSSELEVIRVSPLDSTTLAELFNCNPEDIEATRASLAG